MPARKLHLPRTSFGNGDLQMHALPRMGQNSDFYFALRCMRTVALLNMKAIDMTCIGWLTAQQMQAGSAAHAHMGNPIAQGAAITKNTYNKTPVSVQAITTKSWQVPV